MFPAQYRSSIAFVAPTASRRSRSSNLSSRCRYGFGQRRHLGGLPSVTPPGYVGLVSVHRNGLSYSVVLWQSMAISWAREE